MSDSGLSAFGFCPTCGRGGQVRAVWREAVHAAHRLAAKRTYATNSFLAFAPWFGVPSEWKRAISRGPWNRAMAPFQLFEHPDGALGEMMPVAVGRNL